MENIEKDAWGGNFPMQVRYEVRGKTSRIRQLTF